jgi:glycosyltransferase involved in cell wall biosynthesis
MAEPVRRVLVLTTTFPQYEGDPRGEFLLRHWEERARAGDEVRILAPRTRWCRGTIASPCDIVRVAYAPRALSSLTGRHGILENIRGRPWQAALVPALWHGLQRAVAREIDQWRPDVVVAHMLLPAGWIVARVAAARSVPFELYGHGTDVDLLLRLPAFLRDRFTTWARHARTIYMPSAEKRERFARRIEVDGPRLRVETMIHVVRPPSPVRPRAGSDVLFMGRLIAQKGVDDLLAATALLEPRPTVHIAGDGPERHRLQRQARSLGFGAHFHGFVGGARKDALFRRASLLCVPSREAGGLSEGAPLVIREAFAYGVPVVATRVGGIPEICQGGSATLVSPHCPLELGAAIADVLGRPYRLSAGQARRSTW